MSIFIGGAWPYANGSLHLGHIAALLPGDILARYYRLKGEQVLYVSGSDCNGTPISIRANQEGTTVKVIADYYHAEFTRCFHDLGFTYDFYTRTDSEVHHEAVQKLFLTLRDNGYLYTKKMEQAYCPVDAQFLPDRFVEGLCPVCGAKARGDQCDNCSTILDPLDLHDKQCKICGTTPEIRETEHFYYEFSAFQQQLEQLVAQAEQAGTWRDNALQLTKRYLQEGVPDRAVTRDLPNGIAVPLAGFDGKKIYVWIEAVAGYYTASLAWAEQTDQSLASFWPGRSKAYYVHGKDNIPFHTIIWPAILMGAHNEALPTHIISNEYLTLEKRKLSTSQNWAVWVPEFLQRYEADSLRYFLTINAPENRDADFSWREFVYSHNSELLGAFANFVNRNLKFIEKAFDGRVPQVAIDGAVYRRLESVYETVGQLIEEGHLKQALEIVFDNVRSANRYFDDRQPWRTLTEAPEECAQTLSTCVLLIENFAQLLQPVIPFACEKIARMLSIEAQSWVVITTLPTAVVDVAPLYERIDVAKIDEELERLRQRAK